MLVSISPLVLAPKASTPGVPTNLTLPRPYDNLAVPGANVNDCLNKVTDGGGVHDLILRGLGTQVQQALALQPTFITVWIGSNDALGAAVSGIVINGVTLTKLNDFNRDYRAIVSTLQTSGADMALATVPNVTVIPWVTTIPPIVIDPATSQPVIIDGQTVPLIGPDGPLTLGVDYVLLTASAYLAQGIGIPAFLGGTGLPLPDDAVLSGSEVATISDRVNGFNDVIRTVAGEFGAAVVDTFSYLNDVAANGFHYGGMDFSTDFLTGGVFSYDGVHPTSLGYAETANFFIQEINAHFGGSIRRVNMRPFIFGGLGATPYGYSFEPYEVAGVQFTKKAYKNLRETLGIPKTKKLIRIKRKLNK
jgi:lysophospholipase L1-like esterase